MRRKSIKFIQLSAQHHFLELHCGVALWTVFWKLALILSKSYLNCVSVYIAH